MGKAGREGGRERQGLREARRRAGGQAGKPDVTLTGNHVDSQGLKNNCAVGRPPPAVSNPNHTVLKGPHTPSRRCL